MAEFDDKIQEAQEEISQAEAVLAAVRVIHEKRHGLIARREAVKSENARKLASISTELTESLDELEKMSDTFNQKFSTMKQERDGM